MVKFLFFPFLSAFYVKFIRYLIDNGANPCYNTIRYLTKRTGGIMPTIDEDILGMLRRLNAMSRRMIPICRLPTVSREIRRPKKRPTDADGLLHC